MSIYAAAKPGAQTVTSSTTLVNETDLAVTMAAGDTWVVTWELYVTGPNIKVAVTVPTSAVLAASAAMIDSANPSGAISGQTSTSGTAISLGTISTAPAFVTVTATVIGDGTHSGTITLQFAQSSSNGLATGINTSSSVYGVQK